jgi:hypothetical protein
MNWIPRFEPAIYVAIASTIIALVSLGTTIWNTRSTRALTRRQRRTQVLNDLFALQIKLTEAHQENSGAQADINMYIVLREAKGAPLPRQETEETLRSAVEHLDEIERLQRDCDDFEHRFEEESNRMSSSDLEEMAVDINAIRSDVEIVLKRAVAFRQELQKDIDFEKNLRELRT